MKLSVIIPVYRVESTLDRCVESVCRQAIADMEVILVDDGSPDTCPQRCDEWSRRDTRIRVLHKANGGLSDARNAGIEVASGELITFVDSDDYLDDDSYSQALQIMEEDATCDIVEFPLYWHHGTPEQTVLGFGNTVFDDMGDYWLHGEAYRHTYAWNKVYRRMLFDTVRFPVGRVFEDVATLPLLLDKARRVRTTTAGLYYYCSNTGGITATAGGPELTQLLQSHIEVLPRWVDDAYYMHVLNIQFDVCRLTDAAPLLPMRRVALWRKHYSKQQYVKALLLNLIGIDHLCRLNTRIQRLTGCR